MRASVPREMGWPRGRLKPHAVASSSSSSSAAVAAAVERGAKKRAVAARAAGKEPARGLKRVMAAGNENQTTGSQEGSAQTEPMEMLPRSDDVLPDNLRDAILQASEATAIALKKGARRCTVEVLLPEFWDPVSGAVFSEEGDQQRFWKLTRRFIDNLAAATKYKEVKVVYPDIGVAAMLQNQWGDAPFSIASLNDRNPVREEDDLVIIAAPDPQGADDCSRIASGMDEETPLILFNPRLASGDVGIGLNVRRLRKRFLESFLVTYSIQPIGAIGSVFRRYPGMWQVFIQDEDMPGRYKLAAERLSKPDGDVLANIIRSATTEDSSGEESAGAGLLDEISTSVTAFQKFVQSLFK